MQAAEPETGQVTPQQRSALLLNQGPLHDSNSASSSPYPQAPTQVTASPQIGTAQSGSLGTAELVSAGVSASLQLSPSQRRAQSSAIFAAVAAATQMQPKLVPETGTLTLAVTR